MKTTPVPVVERAFQLARTGAFAKDEIARQLKKEGYMMSIVERNLKGSALRHN